MNGLRWGDAVVWLFGLLLLAGRGGRVWAAAMALASALEENVDDSLIGAVAVAEEVEARRTSAAGAG